MTGRRPFREKVDMAVFGHAPDFARASVRLVGVDPARGARQAAALLTLAARQPPSGDAAEHIDAWRAAYAAVGLEGAIPPPAALAAWAAAPGGVPSQGSLADVVHAFSLQHGLPAAAYDLDATEGDLWLRPSRGCEHFLGVGSDRATSPDLNELILADDRDFVLARAWHGSQGRAAIPGPGARHVLAHLDFLPPLAADAERLAGAFARLATGFVGGAAEVRWLVWETPAIAWPAA